LFSLCPMHIALVNYWRRCRGPFYNQSL
jgi:hypothetical protein